MKTAETPPDQHFGWLDTSTQYGTSDPTSTKREVHSGFAGPPVRAIVRDWPSDADVYVPPARGDTHRIAPGVIGIMQARDRKDLLYPYLRQGKSNTDNDGNLAVGYSVSSLTLAPSIRYAARLATDPVMAVVGVAGVGRGDGAHDLAHVHDQRLLEVVVRLHAVVEHDVGVDARALDRVRVAHHGTFYYVLVLVNSIFNFGGTKAVARNVYDIVYAANDAVHTLRIPLGAITGKV